LRILGVVLWIGGVGFVTTVLLPTVRRMTTAEEHVAFFEAVEQRSVWQARVTTMLVGATGLYLIHARKLWERFASACTGCCSRSVWSRWSAPWPGAMGGCRDA
jgi:uncharacterized membrane protein